ncbi:hypothetical protein BaRGS_00024356, partial [Batillaria attramentaria]
KEGRERESKERQELVQWAKDARQFGDSRAKAGRMRATKSGSGKREQETICEELAELISASIADMNAFPAKPDKSAILQETVSHLQQLSSKHGQTESGSSSEAVQQSQVSSSKPSIVANELLGSLLLEALEGFLFMVNSQGKVEFVSENVTQYLKYSQDDLVGKSIYNVIHVGDHAQFSNSLVPMSLATSIAWPNDSPSKGRNFNCRMLIKPPCEEDEDVEVKQTYVSQYESMHITAILQPFSNFGHKFSEVHSDTESQACLVCIARRMPLTEKVNMMIGIDQFTTKQDTNGKILAADVRSLPKGQYGEVMLTGNIQDYCHNNDISQLKKHLSEVVKNASNTSGVYRFKLQENRYVFVQTKSKLFYNSLNHQPEYIMSTHSIIRECDSEVELKGSASTSLMKSIIGQSGLGNVRSQHQAMGLGGLSSPTGGGFNMNMHSPMSAPSMGMGGMNIGMGAMNPLGSSNVGGLGGVGGVGSMDPLSDLDFLNTTDWDSLTPSVGVGGGGSGGGGGGLLGGDMMGGGFNSGLNMGGVNVSSVNSGSGLSSMQGFTSSANSWGSMAQMTTSVPTPSASSTPSSLQSALLGTYSLANLANNNITMNATNSSNSGANGKPHPSALTSQLQRSNSASFEGRKSPRYSPSPSPGGPRSAGGPFSVPSQRPAGGVMPYPNQRSPGSAGGGGAGMGVMQNRSHTGQFTMGYRKAVSPLVSPQPGMPPSPVWGRSPNPVGGGTSDFSGVGSVGSMVSQPSPLQALQSMDTQTSSALDMLSPSPGRPSHSAPFPGATPPYDASPGGLTSGGSSSDLRSNQRTGKLCQLLTQNTMDPLGLRSPHASAPGPRPSSTKSAMSITSPGMGKSGGLKSPDDSTHQSPTPGPGTSPPEKPQSTSNEDGENSGGDGEKKDNFILKKLLSEDEDGDPPSIMDQEISSSPQTSGSSSGQQDKNGLDKNEAEPKKPNNVLLKQLLSEENRREQFAESLQKRLQRELMEHLDLAGKGQSTSSASDMEPSRTQGELLHQLLQEEENSSRNTITSAPAESTSQDDGSRSRHQSGQQEPQSTTSLPLTPSPSHHSQMGAIPAPSPISSQVSNAQQLMQDLFMDKIATSTSAPASSTSTATSRHDSSVEDKNLHNLLTTLWERGMDSPTAKEMIKQTKKRKASSSEADRLDSENEPTTSGGAGASGSGASLQSSKLSQKNALLAQLLSKKAAKENVVNTQLTVNPLGLPQTRIPKNLGEKMVVVKGGRSNSIEEASSSGGDGGPAGCSTVSASTTNVHSSPRTNPNAPFPGNTSAGNKADSSGGGGFNSGGAFASSAASSMSRTVSGMEMGEEPVSSQYEQFHQIFTEGLSTMETDPISNDSSDPLLQQILQQAADLEQDITSGNLVSASSVGSSVGSSSIVSTPHEDQNMLAQLEQLINDGSLQVDSLLGLSGPGNSGGGVSDMQAGGMNNSGMGNINISTSVSEQLAISAIQRQLMGDDMLGGVSSNNNMPMGGNLRAGNNVGGFLQGPNNNSPLSPVAGVGPRGVLAGGVGPRAAQHPQLLGQMQMGPRAFPGPLPPQQVSPAGAVSPGQESPGPMFSPQGMSPQSPQFPPPRGPLASALQGGQQAPFPPRTSLQPNMASLDATTPPGQFPENLRDLMNTGHAPNVTIPVQRGGVVPGPMSPRLPLPTGAALPRQPTPGTQGAPHYPMGHWVTGAGGAGDAIPGLPQGAQFTNLGRHRSLSGNSLPSPGGQGARFQFPGDGQFTGTPGQGQLGPMFSPGQNQGVPPPPPGPNAQQQQMFPQNRMLQRSLSMNT